MCDKASEKHKYYHMVKRKNDFQKTDRIVSHPVLKNYNSNAIFWFNLIFSGSCSVSITVWCDSVGNCLLNLFVCTYNRHTFFTLAAFQQIGTYRNNNLHRCTIVSKWFNNLHIKEFYTIMLKDITEALCESVRLTLVS